jgi:hypothetical protein
MWIVELYSNALLFNTPIFNGQILSITEIDQLQICETQLGGGRITQMYLKKLTNMILL